MRWVLLAVEWLVIGGVFAALFATMVALTRIAEAIEQLAYDWRRTRKEEEIWGSKKT